MTLARIQGHEMNDKNYWNSVVVVGIAIDDQGPLNKCQDRFVETKSGTHRSGLQKSACGFQKRAGLVSSRAVPVNCWQA